MNERPILVICHDVVDRHMAGPGIRAWQLARVLTQYFRVVLAVPGPGPERAGQPSFEVWPYRRGDWTSLSPVAQQAGAILASGDSLIEFPALARLGIPLIVDGYDPHTLEALALWAGETPAFQSARHAERLAAVRSQCAAGDFYICASERQRDWWLGVLEDRGRINALTYADDPSLRRLIDVVPFGLPSDGPRAAGPGLRGRWPGVAPDDWIVLWGGGLWEWLDPLTALRATRRLIDGGLETVRLVFPGTRHPNPALPDMPMRARAIALAEELDLAGRYAFFGDWVPYEDWPAVLLEADVGLSFHPDTAEARLAYRTRVLDYIWAGLPMVVSGGDAAAELVDRYDLGRVVNYGDDAAVAGALTELFRLGRPGLREAYRERFDAARRDLTWERAAEPLVAFCREPRLAADRASFAVAHPAAADTGNTEAGVRGAPDVSVIILTWNGGAYIEACLAAVLAQQAPGPEVIVVDNGSTDGTPDLVARRFPQVRLIRNPRNLGFAAGNNVGLRAAQGDVRVLLNQDTKVHPGWLAALVDAFRDPAVGIAGCKLLYPDGSIQHAGGFLYGPRGESEHLGRYTRDDARFSEPADVEYVTGAALAVRREVLERTGLLDEGFSPAYLEDVDWCYRARAAGYRVVYVPGAIAMHHESTATGAGTDERKFAWHQGRLRFLFKHWPLDRLLDEFGPAERAWAATLSRDVEVMAVRRAYLTTMLALPGILSFRRGSAAGSAGSQASQAWEQEAEALLALLIDLRAAAMASLAGLQVSGGAHAVTSGGSAVHPVPAQDEGGRTRERLLGELEAAQLLKEQPFTSQVPVLGPAIAALRTLWNSVATKWYARPLIHQQSVFNAQVVGYLRVLQDQLDRQAHHLQGWTPVLEGQAHVLEGQVRDVTENVRELTALAERLASLEARLAGQLQHLSEHPKEKG